MSSAGEDGFPTSERHDGSPTVVRNEDLRDLGEPGTAVEQVRAVAGAALAAAYLLGPKADELRLADAVGGPVGRFGLPTACPLSGHFSVAEAVRSNRPLWLGATQVASDSERASAEPGTGLSLGVVPLSAVPSMAGGVARGCLVVVREGPEGFDFDRRTLLELYAEQLSAGMEGGCPRADERAGRGMGRGQGLPSLPRVRIGTFALDRNTGRVDADATLLELFDVAAETFDGYVESLMAHTLLDDLPVLMSIVGRSGATTGVRDLMFRARRSSGEPRWLHLRCKVLADSTGRPGRALGVVADAPPLPPGGAEVSGLQELSTALAGATTVQEVGRTVVEGLSAWLGADRVAFAELRGRRLVVTVLNPPTPDSWPEIWRPDGRTEWLDASLHALPTLEAVLQAGRTSVWPPGSALEPGLAGVGPGCLAALPLSAEGRVIGACLAGWDCPHQVSAGERSWLSVTAGRAAEAMVRAQAFDTEREHVRMLQTSLLPRELPELAGAVAAARYLPATAGVAVGGDWYDVITSDSHLALVIGDVQGHNAEAATIMGQVSTAVRAYSAEGHPPDVVLARANRLLVGMKTELFATCCYVSLDIEEGSAWFVRAGHPPPLLRQPDGVTEQVAVAGGPPLGVLEDADFPITVVDVAPGAVLALVTDGLVESADLAMDEGLCRMGDVLGAADPSDVGRVADVLISGANRRDDAALLLLRYDGLTLRPVRSSWRVWRIPEAVMHARRFTARTLRSWGVSEEDDVVKLVVSELVTNAVVHTQGDVRLDLTLAADRLRVAVTDSMPRAPVKPRTMDWESTGGRGIMLVEAMSTAWGSVPVGGGKQVWSEIALPPREIPGPDVTADEAGPAEVHLRGPAVPVPGARR
ncbi:SpoIIE family protein phosphatase [Streptomyces himalayensis]|uniref:protein-serine/threonine phosphatase n=1 Tax=Streptomyces himalayensis subsp. himalayensis TaxID=2756131 RepID=A0A7W0DTZ9_9ACTN|nr:SpoIIE family protein phosphatase [Streptomyces himalayensis]MBA2950424.1 SpoIIE family protein phosphatase [Streptomyces himalayensis subsp. himalayensis]